MNGSISNQLDTNKSFNRLIIAYININLMKKLLDSNSQGYVFLISISKFYCIIEDITNQTIDNVCGVCSLKILFKNQIATESQITRLKDLFLSNQPKNCQSTGICNTSWSYFCRKSVTVLRISKIYLVKHLSV